MNSGTNNTPSSTETIHDGDQSDARDSETVDKIARRRLLLSSVSGGVVLLAAASPIKALAQTSTCTNNQCTISGMKSANHSFKPGECDAPCGGYSPGFWGQVDHTQVDTQGRKKPGETEYEKTPRRSWPTNHSQAVNTVLVKSALNISLFELMWNHKYASSDERHWICAWLNAQKSPPGYNFPYSKEEVIGFYMGDRYHEALSFFKNYMETHNS